MIKGVLHTATITTSSPFRFKGLAGGLVNFGTKDALINGQLVKSGESLAVPFIGLEYDQDFDIEFLEDHHSNRVVITFASKTCN